VLPDPSAVNILIGVNASITAAMGVLYRDCRKDRERLWKTVNEIRSRIGDYPASPSDGNKWGQKRI